MDEFFMCFLSLSVCLSWFLGHEKSVRLLGLTTSDGQRFFEAIHASPNTKLFRDNFRMDAQAFDALFERCKPFISDTVRDQRELLAVALIWIGTGATCRAQELAH
ncbi:DNA polymerase IV [Phytophthora palmivora]|uniref:DNA polymerase IV n=1 Tax=Phytophthora palmivora TaxID=4796 RepID=A0A2P4Y947_9STRA|nr:DNA polymerase IV [Phytophthora palmivora]